MRGLGCILDAAAPITQHRDRGRHCCWKCHGVNTGLREVRKTTLTHNGLVHGIHEAAKASDKHHAHLCVLTSNCDGCQVGGGPEPQSNQSKVRTARNKATGWASRELTGRENPVKWLVAVVWWLRTIVKSLRPRMSSRRPSNASNEQKNLGFCFSNNINK